MDQEPDVIRHDIEETRSSITEKLVTLEDQVRCTVQNAKETVTDTIENVRSTVNDTVQTVKQTFDVRYQTRQHPWGMTGASVAAGFLAGYFLPRLARREPDFTKMAQASYTPLIVPRGNGAQERIEASRHEKPGMLSRLAEQFEDEIQKVKGLAIGTVAGLVRDWVSQNYPQMRQQFTDIMDSATRKLGGQPVEAAEPVMHNGGACRY